MFRVFEESCWEGIRLVKIFLKMESYFFFNWNISCLVFFFFDRIIMYFFFETLIGGKRELSYKIQFVGYFLVMSFFCILKGNYEVECFKVFIFDLKVIFFFDYNVLVGKLFNQFSCKNIV